jgi:glycosyltransferase involved in cell wall biosynthesis
VIQVKLPHLPDVAAFLLATIIHRKCAAFRVVLYLCMFWDQVNFFFVMIKKVLVITYYWPPAGGAGVQRWLKMSKYLPEFGWMPVIYTPEVTESPVDDPTLLQDVHKDIEVIRRPILEPYNLYKWFVRKKKGERVNAGFLHEGKPPALAERISVWIRGNFFIPDARCLWINPSVRFLCKYLKDHPVDVIISTGPPHSMHMIGMKVARRTGLPWIADFRDPWTNIDFYHKLRLTGIADRIHRRMEQHVIAEATRLVTIGWGTAEDFVALGAQSPVVITNGFDTADFQFEHCFTHDVFSITHAGVMNDDRNPVLLWEALSELVKEDSGFAKDLRIRLIGRIDYTVVASLEHLGLLPYTERVPYLPHHEAVHAMADSALLLLAINNSPVAKGILTGKLFEYLAVNRPILCMTPVDGDSARVIREANAGTSAGYAGAVPVKEQVKVSYCQLF